MKKLYALLLVTTLIMSTALKAGFKDTLLSYTKQGAISAGKLAKKGILGALGTGCLYLSFRNAAFTKYYIGKAKKQHDGYTIKSYYDNAARNAAFSVGFGILGIKLMYEALKSQNNNKVQTNN